MSTVLARPYAKALFELAQESDRLSLWEDFLDNLSAILDDVGAKRWLLNPQYTLSEKVAFLFSTSSKGASFVEGERFLWVLASAERLMVLPDIACLFKKFKKVLLKELDVEVISAYPLSQEALGFLKHSLSARWQKQIILHDTVDPTLIGGVVVRAEGWVLDGSLKGRFERLASVVI